MSKDRKILLIVLGLITIIIVSNLRIVEEMPLNQKKKYNIEANNPLGLSVFYNLLKESYGNEKIKVINSLSSLDSAQINKTLLIRVGDTFEPNDEKVVDLLKRGLHSLVAAQNIFLYLDTFLIETSNAGLGDSINICFDRSYQYQNTYGYEDTLINFYLYPLSISSINENYETYNSDIRQDSNLLGQKTVKEEDDNFPIKTLENSGSKQDEIDSSHTVLTDYNIIFDTLISANNRPIAVEVSIDSGTIILHAIPRLFTNIATINEELFLDHFNYLLTQRNYKSVYILRENELISGNQSKFNEILANKGFRAAYIVFLIASLLYILFGLKRYMRPIQLLVYKQNTTLDYVGILARLYKSHKRPNKLVEQMRHNFIRHIEYHFNISSDEPDFINILHKKSKVDLILIESILNDFKRLVQNKNIADHQLVVLHNKIRKFKELCNDRKNK
ncbi:MAG TPA: hypothetical protein PKD85_02670 [Saprospiraceae bacterium]|nr:hypothetical protein [Saprospiraceae bacterium]